MKKALAIIFTLAALLCSCAKVDPDFSTCVEQKPTTGEVRHPSNSYGNVLLLYLAGRNSLSSYLKTNYDELLKGYIPRGGSGPCPYVLLVYEQFPESQISYNGPLESTLLRLYTDFDGQTVTDTLKTYGSEYISADSQTVKTVLSDVSELFPSENYGLLFSSHATGWLPAGHTTTSATESRLSSSASETPTSCCQDLPIRQHSIGQTIASGLSYEMDLKNFARAIPFHLNYILFDCCLMGCVEVAYELKDKCDLIAFSPTEVLAEGFDYTTLTEHLFRSEGPDIGAVCDDMFARYTDPKQIYPYCTISAIDCRNIEPLAEVCRSIIENHRNTLALLKPYLIQGYFRFGWHWFYDLRDIFDKAGASAEELSRLDEALGGCIVRNLATDKFIEIDIKTHCGLSMYLPCNGSPTLDAYYKTLSWNEATSLVL